jgi:hypothetical protein
MELVNFPHHYYKTDMANKFTCLMILISVICSCKNSKPGFEKIIYHTSSCFGTCPVYHLEIKNNKEVRVFAETVYKHPEKMVYEEDFEKEGYFVGKASNLAFKKLDSIVQHIGLDTLKFGDVTCCDGIIYTIIVYYNGERKVFKSMFPPEEARDLIATLNDICKNSSVKHSSKDFVLETMKGR